MQEQSARLQLLQMDRHRHAPLQVARDASAAQPLGKPRFCNLDRVLGPAAFLACLFNPRANLALQLGKVDEKMSGLALHRRCLAQLADGIDELVEIQELSSGTRCSSSAKGESPSGISPAAMPAISRIKG